MTDAAKLGSVTPVRVGQLRADPQNPRFTDGDETLSQDALIARLWKEMAAEEIAMSIAANGFFEHEPLFAEEGKERTRLTQ